MHKGEKGIKCNLEKLTELSTRPAPDRRARREGAARCRRGTRQTPAYVDELRRV